MATLPGELVDSIIDSTHRISPSSLIACALVCRQWLPRSRYHTFSLIHLIRHRSADTVKMFLHLIASPLVTFISSIREVALHHRPSYGAPVLSAGDIILLLSRYGIHPARLYLDCQFNQLGMRGVQQDSFASVTHLRLTLSMNMNTRVPLEQIFDYTRMFPSLQSLSLRTDDISLLPRTTPRVLPPDLHELVLDGPEILHGLLSIDSPPAQFSSLNLTGIAEWEELNQYLANPTISGSLKSLTLSWWKAPDYGQLDLSHLGALRYLRVRDLEGSMPRSIVAVLASLRWSSSPLPLETIELFVELENYRQEMDCEQLGKWRAVDTALADSGILGSHLRRLAVSTFSGGHPVDFPENIRDVLRQRMPLCHARRILVIL
ncbi:hypothetical protein DFH09DRAFT_59241 [Mycena vulgaris]|nr:hypothetical protein DFH09DRAFT_59241 [Mycena vulgaris]